MACLLHRMVQLHVDFNEVKKDGVTAASVGPHVNHLQLDLDNHASTSLLIFLQTRCSS